MNTIEETTDDGSKLLTSGYAIALVVAICAVVIVGAFTFRFHSFNWSSDSQHWGQFGDYVGGLVNPLVGIATVLLVLINIRIQQRELKASLHQMQLSNKHTARQSFEQSLFAWLSNYRELLQSINIGNGTKFGRDALLEWYWRRLSSGRILRETISTSIGELLLRDSGNPNAVIQKVQEGILAGRLDAKELHFLYDAASRNYTNLYKEHRTDLDALFRTLYRLFLWIDSYAIDLDQKRHYASLVRAQLSWIELVYLLFNGLTPEGKKFATLCNKYAMFDNLVVADERMLGIIKTDLPKDLPNEFNPSKGGRSWPYTASAFSSDIARLSVQETSSRRTPMFARGLKEN